MQTTRPPPRTYRGWRKAPQGIAETGRATIAIKKQWRSCVNRGFGSTVIIAHLQLILRPDAMPRTHISFDLGLRATRLASTGCFMSKRPGYCVLPYVLCVAVADEGHHHEETHAGSAGHVHFPVSCRRCPEEFWKGWRCCIRFGTRSPRRPSRKFRTRPEVRDGVLAKA